MKVISAPRMRVHPFFVITVAVSQTALALAQSPIIQPGAPGTAPRTISAEEAIEIANTSYSPADARFMQNMIPHHQQAVEMAALVAGRTNTPELHDIAKRIDAAQQDEIAFMQQWLQDRNELIPDPADHHAMQVPHSMAGMATAEQMTELEASEGLTFDRRFLELMINHHAGAVRMVEELLAQRGSAYDPALFEFVSDVTNDQTAEIERMNLVLSGLSSDPRAGLEPGFDDAGEALYGLDLVASLGRPPGFFDPENVLELPSQMLVDTGKPEEEEFKEDEKRTPFLSFANTDMAFAGNVLVTGSYHGFNIYRLLDDGRPDLVSSVVCPGGQGDVSIVGHLLIVSVEQTRGRLDCGLQGIDEDISAERFRGIRIFDISDLARPVQVGAVQTCRGSHTHSVVSGPDENGKIIVYVSGTSSVRDEEELSGCFNELPGDIRTALFRIDVVEIPMDEPAMAKIVHSPAVFADEETGALAGLWRGGDHGDDTQETRATDQCHDITVFPEAAIAAGACAGNGILFDISDPLQPRRIDAVVDKGFAYWHSATFNNDGTKIIFTDEWGGGTRPRCRAYDPLEWGADAIYDIVDGELVFGAYYKMPAPQTEQENCVAHNGSIIPVPGRDIFVQAWYQGGVSVMDFTDSRNPVEIAYFDRGPLSAEVLVLGGHWSTYYYDGYIYGSEIARGLDVLALQPSEYLSENEIAAATVAVAAPAFNPQQQFELHWPDVPVVAQAYVDQLKRSDALAESLVSDLVSALTLASREVDSASRDRKLASRLRNLAKQVRKGGGDPATVSRRAALADSLVGIAKTLR